MNTRGKKGMKSFSVLFLQNKFVKTGKKTLVANPPFVVMARSLCRHSGAGYTIKTLRLTLSQLAMFFIASRPIILM